MNVVSWISQILNCTEAFLCYFTLRLHPAQEHVNDKHYSSRLDLTVLYMYFMLMSTCCELMAVLTAPQRDTSEITTTFGYNRRHWALQTWSLISQKRRQASRAKNLGSLSHRFKDNVNAETVHELEEWSPDVRVQVMTPAPIGAKPDLNSSQHGYLLVLWICTGTTVRSELLKQYRAIFILNTGNPQCWTSKMN